MISYHLILLFDDKLEALSFVNFFRLYAYTLLQLTTLRLSSNNVWREEDLISAFFFEETIDFNVRLFLIEKTNYEISNL